MVCLPERLEHLLRAEAGVPLGPTPTYVSEVGGAKPKVSPTGKSSSEFDVFALSRFAYASRDVRDVSCVTCRA